MVNPATPGAAAIALMLSASLTAPPAHAQSTVDWRGAGGDLFVRVATDDAVGPPDDAPIDEIVRLTAPEQPFGRAIAEAAERHGLDPKLLHALVIVESAYRTTPAPPSAPAV